jgi:hypothetical protein
MVFWLILMAPILSFLFGGARDAGARQPISDTVLVLTVVDLISMLLVAILALRTVSNKMAWEKFGSFVAIIIIFLVVLYTLLPWLLLFR